MNRLIYIADPMCSWCYGFIPELALLKEHYKNQLRFSLIMGGLRPGGGQSWDKEMKDFLRHHWEKVAQVTNQPFAYSLLDLDNFNYDTEPSCRAVVVVRDMNPEKAFLFLKEIQHSFYFSNDNPNELNFYVSICQKLNISEKLFEEKFLSKEYREKTAMDFAHSRKLGIRGFPSLLLATGESVRLVTHGYARFETMRETIDELASRTS